MWVVEGARRRIKALDSQKMVRMVAGSRLCDSVSWLWRRESKSFSAIVTSCFDRNLLTSKAR